MSHDHLIDISKKEHDKIMREDAYLMPKKKETAKKMGGSVSYKSHAHDKHELPSNPKLKPSKRGVHHDYY